MMNTPVTGPAGETAPPPPKEGVMAKIGHALTGHKHHAATEQPGATPLNPVGTGAVGHNANPLNSVGTGAMGNTITGVAGTPHEHHHHHHRPGYGGAHSTPITASGFKTGPETNDGDDVF